MKDNPSPREALDPNGSGPLLLAWFNAMAEVVYTASCAADDSSDDFDPETHVAVPNDSFQALSDALEALEDLVPESSRYVGTGALNDEVRQALASLSRPPVEGAIPSKAAPLADEEAVERARGIIDRAVTQYENGDTPKGTVGIWMFLQDWQALRAALSTPLADVGVGELVERYVLEVNEYDDRTSPEDWPEALLITGDELSDLLKRFAGDLATLSPRSDEQIAENANCSVDRLWTALRRDGDLWTAAGEVVGLKITKDALRAALGRVRETQKSEHEKADVFAGVTRSDEVERLRKAPGMTGRPNLTVVPCSANRGQDYRVSFDEHGYVWRVETKVVTGHDRHHWRDLYPRKRGKGAGRMSLSAMCAVNSARSERPDIPRPERPVDGDRAASLQGRK